MSKKKKKQRPPLPELPAGVGLIDSHCHLDMAAYQNDRQEVIARARAAGVDTIMTIGIDRASSAAAVEIAANTPGVHAAVGVHPHHSAETTDDDYNAIRELARRPEVVAYGEIGLDYVKDYAPAPVQRRHFSRQLGLAKELNLPVIIHDREAHEDCMAILAEHGPYPAGGVMHCFSGGMKLAEEVMDLGFFVSIPGVVTFNKAETMQEVARFVPLERLLVETDGPFLTPVPYRGQRNEPAYVLYTAARIAALRGIELAQLAHAVCTNTNQLFGLDRGERP